MIFLNTFFRSLITCLKPKIDKELTKQIGEIDALAKKALNHPNASLKLVKVTSTTCDLLLHLGPKGPINSWYIDDLVIKQILHNLLCKRTGSSLLIEGVAKEAVPSIAAHFRHFVENPRPNPYKDLEEIHKDCFDDLTENQPKVMAKFSSWELKRVGGQPGIICKKPNNKTTFIKRCSVEEGLDSTLFSVADACGVIVPKTQIVDSGNHCYLFSKDLGKNAAYKDLAEYLFDPTCFVDFKTLTVHLDRQDDGSFKETVSIERLSIAKIILAAAIFGLHDLHGRNIGLVLQNRGGIKLFQLAMCDCDISPLDPFITMIVDKKYDSFGACVQDSVLLFSYEKHRPLLQELITPISNHEFLMAFEQFKQELPKARPSIEERFAKEPRLLETIKKRWAHNFKILYNIAHEH